MKQQTAIIAAAAVLLVAALMWRQSSLSDEITELRAVRSRPDKGLVFARNTGTNQAGELVFSFVSCLFVDRHPA